MPHRSQTSHFEGAWRNGANQNSPTANLLPHAAGRLLLSGALSCLIALVSIMGEGIAAAEWTSVSAAQSSGATATGRPAQASQVDKAGHFAFAMGDTISVTVVNHADLSGQFVIGPDGAFRHPLAGSIAASGRSWEDVERDLQKKLNQLLSYDVRISVDIAAYRPVFVIGDVTRAGEVAFTPGMNTLMAFARAGGAPSLWQLPRSQMTAAALAERDLQLAETELASLLIRRAALEAALAGKLEITLPDELKPVAESDLIKSLLARESAVLEGEREGIMRRREMTTREQEHLELEISALADEQKLIASQGEVIEVQRQRILQAAERGLVTGQRVLNFERFKADNDSSRFRIVSSMSRARQRRVDLEQRQQQEEDQLKQERLRQRLAVETDIERARARIDRARTELTLSSQAAASASVMARPEPSFSIRRTTDDGPVDITADAATRLLPGDVLEVRMISSQQPFQTFSPRRDE